MTTFPRGHHAYLQRLAHLKAHPPTPDTTTTTPTTTFAFPNPTDLRGIPAIGQGVPGHIRGTQPETAATR